MTWRKCLVRGLVFTALGGLVLAGCMYALWTNPTAMRQLVKEQLGDRFVQVNVQLDHAHMRLLGGILVEELRMARTDGLDSSDFLYVPSAVIYHDKEHMLEGKMSVRKVDLTCPQLRLVRDRDGKFNLDHILGPIDLSERMPTVVIRGGTITFEDHALASGSSLIEIHNVHMTMINDPLPTLQIEGGGDTDVLGPIQFRATVPRLTLAASVQIDLPAVQVGSQLQRRAALLCPQAAAQLEQLTGLAEVHARLQMHDEGPRPFSYTYDVNTHFRHGRWEHPLLPAPLKEIDLEVRCTDNRIPAATLAATCGVAPLQARVADFRLPADRSELDEPDHLLRELDFSVKHLEATPALLARLPDFLQFIKEDYSPSGLFSLSYTYRQAGAEEKEGGAPSTASLLPVPISGSGYRPMQKEWLVEPEGMSSEFIDFRYPLKDVRGKIRIDTSASPLLNVTLDLSARTESRGETSHQRAADNHLITLQGTVKGEKKTPEVMLDVHGEDVELDDRILHALPPRAKKVALQFLPERSRRLGLKAHPMGTADFHAAIRRQSGKTRLDKRFTITFKKAALKYDQFPYPLENVTGVLVIHPNHWECKNFRGGHSGGEIVVDGCSEPLPGGAAAHGGEGSRPEIIRLHIHGQDLLLDQEFEQSLSPVGGNERKALQKAWRTLALAGRMNFDAEVVDHPNHPQDIDVNVAVQGCTMKPTFFDYALTEVSGAVRYSQGKVFLRGLRARHAGSGLELDNGLIQLKPGGGFLAWLLGIHGRNLLPDQELLLALPEGLRKGFLPLRLEKPLDVVTALTIDAPPGGVMPMKVWWDGGMALDNATVQTGVEVKEATGQFSCRGYYDGQQLRGMFGDLVLQSATILGQPLSGLHGRLEVLPDSPEVIRVRDFKATLFGGSIGGEARLEVGPMLRYDVLVEALGVQLDQFGRHNMGENAAKAQLQGPVRSALHLQGEGADLTGLKGNGRLDVAQGKMGQLPVLLDLLKAFGLRMPDRTAFEEAHMVYAIEGPQVRVQQLDLYGNAVSLRGQGTVDLDGKNLNLDFTATPGRFVQVLPSVIDLIPQLISEQILKIKMRGKLGKGGDIRFDKELAPTVVDPLRRVIGGE